MNGLINKILLYCILVGPAIAIGVWAGAFPGITYLTCASLVGLCVILYLTHSLCLKYTPTSGVTKYAALIMVELILMYMCINHVGIYLSLFLVPIMSLLYCEKKTYLITSGVCYTCMVVCEALISHYTSSVRIDLNAYEWFVGIIGGMTIEYVIMFLAGYAINKVMIERNHGKNDFHIYRATDAKQEEKKGR